MPPITSARAATDIALDFVRHHRLIARPVKAKREDGVWVVEVDVGAFLVRIGTVRMDAETGEILDFGPAVARGSMLQEQRSGYRSQSLHYLENARLALDNRELEKAGEFLWGSFAEALKAVMARKGLLFGTHRDLRRYARELARQLQDTEIEDAFMRADRLHANFYEAFLEPDELQQDAETIARGVRKLISLSEAPLVE